jgi:hypothetical protein
MTLVDEALYRTARQVGDSFGHKTVEALSYAGLIYNHQ